MCYLCTRLATTPRAHGGGVNRINSVKIFALSPLKNKVMGLLKEHYFRLQTNIGFKRVRLRL